MAAQHHVKPAAPRPSPAPPNELEGLRVNIARTIRRYFSPLFLVTLAFAVFLCVIIGTKLVTSDVMEKMALAGSVQVAFGMVIGFVCVYIGLMMTWFGIDASYNFSGKLDAGGSKGEVSLKSASPGLLFALGGMVLIAVSLHKEIVYKDPKGGFGVDHVVTVPTEQKAGGAASPTFPLKPDPPPPTNK